VVAILVKRMGDCRLAAAHTPQAPEAGDASALWMVTASARPGLLGGNAVSRIACNSWDSFGLNPADSAGERKPLPPIILFPHNCPIARPLKGNAASGVGARVETT